MRPQAASTACRCLIVLVLAIGPGYGRSGRADEPAQKQSPKRVKFAVDNQPWQAVFRWLSDETGKPIISHHKPTGTFTFKGPPGKEYTIPEVVDFVNDALESNDRTDRYELIYRERSFTLVPADEPFGGRALRICCPEHLEFCRRREPVRIDVTLTWLDADEIAPIIQKLMGPSGEVIPIKMECRLNQLLLTGTRDQLKAIIRQIEDLDKSE